MLGWGFSSQVNDFSYDGMGDVTNNGADTYAYDVEGHPVTVDSILITYDAFGRAVQQNRSGVSTQILYGPSGAKFAFMNGSTLIKYIDPMVAGMAAVHNGPNGQPPNSGYYQHADWLGSSRFAQDGSGNVIYDRAYAPFGEVYDETAITNRNFTGQTEDTTPGLYDFLFRQQSRTQGRWMVPDPAGLAAVDITNPQTWNRYAYLANNPLNATDPLGLDDCATWDQSCNGQWGGAAGGP
ncbi:MAG: RHS repeat-associated core domain-containing protein, partial [Candidatus Korobacteraceae bacterium]